MPLLLVRRLGKIWQRFCMPEWTPEFSQEIHLVLSIALKLDKENTPDCRIAYFFRRCSGSVPVSTSPLRSRRVLARFSMSFLRASRSPKQDCEASTFRLWPLD